MEELSEKPESLCPNCGADDNDAVATYCETCGSRLGSSLFSALPPPDPLDSGAIVAGKFRIDSLLWSAPTYNAYSATADGSNYTIIEQRMISGDPLAGLSDRDPAPRRSQGGDARTDESPGEDSGRQAESLFATDEAKQTDPAAAFERFGILKPIQHTVAGENLYIVFAQINGQPVAYMDQTSEKEVRSIGLQLCDLAERFNKHGWVYNGFEPHSVILEYEGGVRLISFDRARLAGTTVETNPIYPSRGYSAPELFEPGAVYDTRSDVYSIGALLQFLLAGEGAGLAEGGTTLYPIATVVPKLERLVASALAEAPTERFQTVEELRHAVNDLNLPIILQSGHFTDVGLVRELNEDSVLALNLTQYYESVQTQIGLYIVSDGMGGEAAGEVASRITVRAIAEWVTEKLISASLKATSGERLVAATQTGGLKLAIADGNDMATTEMLKMAVINANREVMQYARENPHQRGLGATVTVAMIVGDLLTIAHVGDSRCYALSGDRLEQLTEDHSLVQRMINTGNLSRAEARMHPYRNVIYRSIGADEQIEIDIIRRKLKSGDIILLCSDGLNGMLSDDQIRDILMVNTDPTLAAKELVVAANAKGGEDNISAVVARIT